jgi:hypothetical protein
MAWEQKGAIGAKKVGSLWLESRVTRWSLGDGGTFSNREEEPQWLFSCPPSRPSPSQGFQNQG